MIWNVGILWADQHASLATPLGAIPASWFNSIDAFVSIIAVPPLVAWWRWQARRGREPGDIGKIAIGSALTGAAADRKSVVSGKSGSVRVDLGGRRIIKKKRELQ